MTTTCRSCTATVSNGLALCENCTQTLRVALVNVAAFYTDALGITPGQRVKVRSAYKSTPPPGAEPRFDPVAATTGYVDAVVDGWCRNLTDDRPGIGTPPGDTAKACGWLESCVSSIVTLEWAGEILREMLDLERALQRLLDKSDTGKFAGICGNEIGREVDDDGLTVSLTCPRGLYRTESSPWVRCPECGRTWDAEQRRVKMRADAADELAPIRTIARVVVGLTDEVSQERLTRRIEQWVHREQLQDYGVRVLDGQPRRVYRIGDVLALVSGEVKPRDSRAC